MIQLYDWQIPSAQRLADILGSHAAALNASATGTGKTFVGLDVARRLGKAPLVVAPKSAITMWRRTAEQMGVPIKDVVNLEMLKTGKTPWVKKLESKKFLWNLEENDLIFVDECHKVSGIDTANSKLLAVAKPQNLRVLLMSATPFDSPLKMRTLGYLLGLHRYVIGDFFRFCRQHGCTKNPFHYGLEFTKGPKAKVHLDKIRIRLEPLMVRLTVDDVPGFPENVVYPELHDLDTEEINAIYATLRRELKEAPKSALVAKLRARQKVELFKVPLLVDLARDMVAEGYSVVLFVAFRETVEALRKELESSVGGCSIIIGGQSRLARDLAIETFQTDQTRVCVATIDAGGESIGLHHTATSQYPRRTLITPGYSAHLFTQCLGRAPRAGGLSKTIQRVVLAAGTVEEDVYRAIQRKLKNIETLVDGDLDPEL